LSAATLAPASGSADARAQERPNVVVVMTDDQEAASLRFMPQVQSLLAEQGVSFDNSFASYSFCCPSRATFMTGQYAHNHGVLSNEPPLGGYGRLEPTLDNTLPVWLQEAGYNTAHVGRYLHGYGLYPSQPHGTARDVPPGWNEWYGSYGQGAFWYQLNESVAAGSAPGTPTPWRLGTIVAYGGAGSTDPAIYQTDVFTGKAVDYIERRAPADEPFFLSVAPFAPHVECGCANDPQAAPRHEGLFAGEPLPKNPDYNEADVSDKPELTRGMPLISPVAEARVTTQYRNRLESLLSVDDMVGDIVDELSAQGELDNTVIVFTSDNGFLQGEHRWQTGKVLPYETSIKVPLVIRGPGVPVDQTREQLAANIDLAPTILDFAGATPGRAQDGRSLIPVLDDGLLAWNRSIVLEAWYNKGEEYGAGAPKIVYNGLRTQRYMYARHENDERELYDLQSDPYELESRDGDPAYAAIESDLQSQLEELEDCAGSDCGGSEAPPPDPDPDPGPGSGGVDGFYAGSGPRPGAGPDANPTRRCKRLRPAKAGRKGKRRPKGCAPKKKKRPKRKRR
jgi:arylsulfatase A-like enzyme